MANMSGGVAGAVPIRNLGKSCHERSLPMGSSGVNGRVARVKLEREYCDAGEVSRALPWRMRAVTMP